MRRGWLEVPLPAGLDGDHHAAYVRPALLDWYRCRAADRLRPLSATWAERIGVRLGRVLVRDQAKRWGSCDHAGTLRLNWRIVQAPLRLIEYVVAHEFTHVLHGDHGRAFWSALVEIASAPSFRTRRLSRDTFEMLRDGIFEAWCFDAIQIRRLLIGGAWSESRRKGQGDRGDGFVADSAEGHSLSARWPIAPPHVEEPFVRHDRLRSVPLRR